MSDPCSLYLCLSPPSSTVALDLNSSIKPTQNWSERNKKKLKLTLWDSTTFRPIIFHEELEPIMASMGFFPIISENGGANMEPAKNLRGITEPVQWREYAFRSVRLITGSVWGPDSRRYPRLPYPRVDGLHFKTYRVFLAAILHYVNPFVFLDRLHIRPIRLSMLDNGDILKPMRGINPELELVAVYYYRKNTFEDISEDMLCYTDKIKMFMRKDEIKNIEIERDDSSHIVCLINEADALHGSGLGLIRKYEYRGV